MRYSKPLLGLIAFMLTALMLAIPAAAQDDQPVITLERQPCFGTCPVYTVKIYADGTVVYNGERFVDVEGEQTTVIDPDTVKQLLEGFKAAGYLDWNDAYDTMTISDLPTVITSVTIDGETKHITRYTGDDSAPIALPYLENWIDLAAITSQWTGATVTPTQVSGGQSPVITLERQPCFGMCPVYGLSIFADGTVVYLGLQNVAVIGVQVSEIDAASVGMLADMMTATGYFDWQDAYDTMTITDQPTVITSLSTDESYKQITRYEGDANAPVGLTWLEDRIDAVTDSTQWIKQDA